MPKTAKENKKHSKKERVKKGVLFLCSCCAVFLLLLLSGLNLNSYLIRQKVLGTKAAVPSESTITQEKLFWENFLKENPTYFDGWIELAKINIKLGNQNEARDALLKAEKINPNSDKLGF